MEATIVSTFTQNKNLEQPAHGDYTNTWEIPVNIDWSEIDTAFGGSSLLNSTGLSGDTALTVTQYRPLSLLISGTPIAAITYVVPSGVGGQWVFLNGTAGGQTVGIKSGAGGSTITVAAGLSVIVSCDGSASGMRKSITETPAAAGSNTQVQFNSGGVLGATGGFTWMSGATSATGALSVSGTIRSTTGGFVFPDNTVQQTAQPITGVILDYIGTTAPTGYVFANGTTIGSAASAATGRANADTLPLFALLWNSWANTQAPVSGGRGVNAAADFAANKTIAVPDLRGILIAGLDTNGGVASASRLSTVMPSTTPGATGGAQTHTHTVSTASFSMDAPNLNTLVEGNAIDNPILVASQSHSHGNTLSSGTAASGTSIGPTMVMSKIVAL